MYHVDAATYVDRKSINGKGTFALIDMPISTILTNINDKEYYLDSNSNSWREFSTLMNDADMNYPKEWTYNAIYNSFKAYDITNDCNSKFTDADNLVITKSVKMGDELTRRYGVIKWLVWMFLHIVGHNPFTDPSCSYPDNYIDIQNDMIEAMDNFDKVVCDIGHKGFMESIKKTIQSSVENNGANKVSTLTMVMTAVENYQNAKETL